MQWESLADPFLPLAETLRAYDLGKLRRDLVAGLTVAAVEVPQAMAYAVVAGVPPQYGLYTSIVQGDKSALGEQKPVPGRVARADRSAPALTRACSA